MGKAKLKKGQKKRLISVLGGGALFLCAALLHLLHFSMAGDLLFIASGIFAGAMCVSRAARGILSGSFFDENTLMTIAAAGALALGEYAECAAVMTLYQLGELFQSIAVGRSRSAISALGALCPDHANLITPDGEKKVSPRELGIGDTIIIKPGERIPCDCRIEKGSTTVDTSPVTGESLPRECAEKDSLYAGCINCTGLITCTVTAISADSAAERILALAQSASERKTRSETFIKRFARVYTPAVCILAIATAAIVPFVLWLFGGDFMGEFIEWSRRALTMLVISCPCALVISVPLGYFCAMGNASKKGVLIKGSAFIDTLAKVDTAVFDKTGTLTEGELSLHKAVCEGNVKKEELLSLARSAEESSSHPIAKAIVKEAREKYKAQSLEEISGKGVFATLTDGRKIKVVRPESQKEGTAVEVYCDDVLMGTIYFEDRLKPNARSVMAGLKACGIKKTVMLTGDNEKTAKAIGKSAGLDMIESELLPEDKYRIVEELCRENCVMYVGDGINDTPSIARAHAGVAMGALGAQAAIESADIVLMSRDLKMLEFALRIAKKTGRTVKANIVLSLGVKIGVLALAALNLVGMWAAIAADVGVCILAVSNSMRLLK